MLKGRVIRILDEHRLVLNLGSTNGAKRGMRFGIYTPEDPIIDPATNLRLGTLSVRKATVEVTTVRDQFSVCMSAEMTGVLGVGALVGQFGSQRQALPVDRSQIQQLPTGYTVGVGDEAVEEPPPPKPGTPAALTQS